MAALQQGYSFTGEAVVLGAAMREGSVLAEAPVRLPLRAVNRHGLISGATGTGKSKTLAMIAEQLSEFGVPSAIVSPAAPANAIRHRSSRFIAAAAP